MFNMDELNIQDPIIEVVEIVKQSGKLSDVVRMRCCPIHNPQCRCSTLVLLPLDTSNCIHHPTCHPMNASNGVHPPYCGTGVVPSSTTAMKGNNGVLALLTVVLVLPPSSSTAMNASNDVLPLLWYWCCHPVVALL